MQFYEIEIIKIIILLSNYDFLHKMYTPQTQTSHIHTKRVCLKKGIPSRSIDLKRPSDYYLLCMITARLIRGSS